MPKIREYGSPSLEFQATPQESSARLSNSGDMGRAIENVGQAVDSVGDMVYRRQEQEETSSINASFAQLTAQAVEDIDSGTRDGTINSQKFSESLKDQIDSLDQNIGTRAGRHAFERNSARLQAIASKRAARGEAAVKGATAVANVKSEAANLSEAIYSDPSLFKENREAFEASLEDQVTTEGLKATDAEKLRRPVIEDFAKNAIKGWAKLNPSLAQKKLDKGEFDQFLSGDAKAQMQDHIAKVLRDKEVEAERVDRLHDRAQRMRDQAYSMKHFADAVDGLQSVDDVVKDQRSGKISDKMAEHQIELIQKSGKREAGTDWNLMNDWQQRVANEEVSDPRDYQKLYGQGLTKQNIMDLDYMYSHYSDEGKQMNENRKTLFKMAESIRFLDPITNKGYSPIGEAKFGKFKTDLLKAEREQSAAKKPIADLYNPTSPDFFGKRIIQYQTPFANRYSEAAEQMKQQQVQDKQTQLPPLDDFMKGGGVGK